MDYQNIGLDKAIDDALDQIANKYGVTLTKDSYKSRFEQLLQKLYAQKGKSCPLKKGML